MNLRGESKQFLLNFSYPKAIILVVAHIINRIFGQYRKKH